MANVNKDFFTRVSPQKKLSLAEKLTANELLSIQIETIKRFIREIGTGKQKSPNKEINLAHQHRTGNSWNSTIEGWSIWKGKVLMDFYVQYENTDTNTSDYAINFLQDGRYRGEMVRDDHYGNPRTFYFTYDENDKARAIRALIFEYVYTKYADKLKEDAA